MTRVQGYRPMVGEAELVEVIGPRFTRCGAPIDEESSAGGGSGVLPPADPAPEQDEVLLGWVREALVEAGTTGTTRPPGWLGVQLAGARRVWVARQERRAGRRPV